MNAYYTIWQTTCRYTYIFKQQNLLPSERHLYTCYFLKDLHSKSNMLSSTIKRLVNNKYVLLTASFENILHQKIAP